MLTRRATFRLYPSTNQAKQLHDWRRMHQALYNAALYNRKTQYQKFGHSVDYFEQQNCLPAFKEVWTEYKALGSQALQATLKRVDLAFLRFFGGLGGYPKLKTISKMLAYKSDEAGGFYLESPTRQLKPSQRCAKCWELKPKTLADRVHICQHCGHQEDRDVNAAQVNLIWARGQELSSPAAESPSSTSRGSMKQLGALKRQKLQASSEAEITRRKLSG